MSPVEFVSASLADEPRPLNVRVSVDEDPASGAPRVQLFTEAPHHRSTFSLAPDDLKNPERRYRAELAKHLRAVANLGGRGAR